MSKVAFVTAMYNGLYGTEKGGRNRETMYKQSLTSIANIQEKIYVFCFPDHVQEISSYYSDRNIKNIEVIGLDIFSFDFSSEVQKIKNSAPHLYAKDIFWQERCVEIMWGKTRMIKQIIEQNPDLEYVYWIDAGLSNSSILRHYLFPNLNIDDHFTSVRMFTPNFVQNLCKHSDQKITCFMHTRPNNQPIPRDYNLSDYDNMSAMIGGLFGGKVKDMDWFCGSFEKYIAAVLHKKILFPEESIYTGIYNDNKDRFIPIWFDTFYNEDWNEAYNPQDISFFAAMKTLFGDIDE